MLRFMYVADDRANRVGRVLRIRGDTSRRGRDAVGGGGWEKSEVK